MKTRKIKLEEKFILFIFLIGVIGFGLLGYISYSQIGSIMIEQNKEDAMGIAATAARAVDGDVFEAISDTEETGYHDTYAILENFRQNNLIIFIYAMKQEGDHLVFVIDTDVEEPAAFGEAYEFLEDMKPAFAGEVCCDQQITSDKWGTYFSAYAPIFNSRGEVVGIVGADIPFKAINGILGQLRNLIILILSVFSVLSILAYIVLSKHLIGRNMQTEIANYDGLLKRANYLEKKKLLDTYSGILFNIKDFKYVNQKVGPKAGDEVLKLYALTFAKKMKKDDFIASTGGDNFFALVKKGREQDFLDALSQKKVEIELEERTEIIPIPVRAGVYPIKPEDNIHEVMNCCTLAVNTAKKADSDDYQWFEDSMFQEMVREKEILNVFPDAIAQKEFVVFYQPKVDIVKGELYGAEALVRWFRNEKVVSPGLFIPVLEKNNLINQLDLYVFEQVCQDIKKWQSEGMKVVPISSNFSKMHLKNPYFAEEVLDIVSKYEVEPKFIDIELTESSGFYDLEALYTFVSKMNNAGIAVSIDDFGTGYSSLSLLKDLNVDIVKMDKTFFDGLETGDAINKQMVHNVIRMVRDLQKDVICEGIETENQKNILVGYDAHIVQGYYYDKPLPRIVFEERLKQPKYDK